ncbi:TrbM [Neisseria weaveri]|nr:TrbM [Neisseria weaveri]
MKKILASLAASAAIFTSLPAQAGDVLTGDTKLACEAILCLSTGDRPHECAASIKRYFNIRHKKFHKTLEARRNFLNLCPSSNESNMPGLIDVLVNGAGRCDAAELNRINRATYTKKSEKLGGVTQIDHGLQLKCLISETLNLHIVLHILNTVGRPQATM